MKAKIMFVVSSAKLLTRYTGGFQKDEPCVRVLYTEISLLRTSLGKVCKTVSWGHYKK